MFDDGYVPPLAVGRALGNTLMNSLGLKSKFQRKSVSYVSVGDGSVNNSHFLSATTTAEYAKHRGYRCPIVFGISDNDLCISLKGHGWLTEAFKAKLRMPGKPLLGRITLSSHVTKRMPFTHSHCLVIFPVGASL